MCGQLPGKSNKPANYILCSRAMQASTYSIGFSFCEGPSDTILQRAAAEFSDWLELMNKIGRLLFGSVITKELFNSFGHSTGACLV